MGVETMTKKKVLFATDYSEASRHALQFATTLARDWDAVLLIVHVSETEQYPVGELYDEEPKPPAEQVAALEKVVPTDSSVTCEHKLLFGPSSSEIVKPADEIIRFADDQRVDAIVLGTHGRSGLDHLLMGSVAESIMRHASCPVVTIRQAKTK